MTIQERRPWSLPMVLVLLTVWGASNIPSTRSYSMFQPTRLAGRTTITPTALLPKIATPDCSQIPSALKRATLPCTWRRNHPVRYSDSIRLFSTPEDNTPTEPQFDGTNTAVLIVGQSGFILLALVAAYFLQTPNYGLGGNFALGTTAIRQGVLATLPLFGLAAVLDLCEKRFEWTVLQNVSRATQRTVLFLLGPTFRPGLALATSAALGLVAGVGEEMMFRGILQTELLSRLGGGVGEAAVAVGSGGGGVGTLLAVSISSVIFGALHAITPLYAFLATVASYFFGYLFINSDLNLAVPIVCHAVYDLGALFWAHYIVTKTLTDEERRSIWNGEQVTANTK